MPHEVAQEGALRCGRPTPAPAPDRRGRRPWSGGRREELQGDSIGVAEGDTRAVVGVLDSSVRDTKLVQARRPCLQLIAVAAGERHMIKAGAVLVEGATAGLGVGMQAKKLPAAEREHGVMKPPACSSSSRTGSASSSSPYQRVLRSRSVTVTATWVIGGNAAIAASWVMVNVGRLRTVRT